MRIADAFIAALENQGTTIAQVDGSRYDHTEINAAIGAPNETLITDPLVAFLATCFE